MSNKHLKKFAFESKLSEPGRCTECPLAVYDYYNDLGEYRCCFTWDVVPDSEDLATNCPLEEIMTDED